MAPLSNHLAIYNNCMARPDAKAQGTCCSLFFACVLYLPRSTKQDGPLVSTMSTHDILESRLAEQWLQRCCNG